MKKNISAQQAAELLGILTSDLQTLEDQGLIHSILDSKKVASYSYAEIKDIKFHGGFTLAEEANQVNIAIQRKIVSSVSLTQKILLFLAGLLFGYALLVVVITVLFIIHPLQTANFFGYDYRSSTDTELSASVLGVSTESGRVLQAATELARAPMETSVLADVLKPVADTSLVVVKAVDSQTYENIVVGSNESLGIPGLAGKDGEKGERGEVGPRGLAGIQGPAGINGTNGSDGIDGEDGNDGADGSNGTDGVNGVDGSDGTSVADVMTTAGDVIIRNAGNATARLAAGLDGQVLTIAGGLPSWEDAASGGGGVSLLNTLSGELTLAGGGINTIGILGSTITVTGTIPSLDPTYFTTANVSQWTNDSSFITDGNTGWDNSYGFVTSADDTVSGLELDGVFSTTGLLVRTGATTYSTITNNSTNWDTSYTHSTATTDVHGLTFTTEGTGGGLDADTVDGQHAAAFLTAEADTLALVTGRGNTTSTNITTTGTGAITSAGLLTASNGLTMTTGALNLTSTSGSISLVGLTGLTQTLSSGTAAFTAPTLNLNTSSTGNTTIGNSTGTFSLTSSGGLNVTTGGALTGVASIDTISTSATAITFAGTGTLSSGTATALTVDSGTTGALNFGTGANAKTITIGNTTGATVLNLVSGTGGVNIGTGAAVNTVTLGSTNTTSATTIQSGTGNVNFTVGPTSSSGRVRIGNSATATPDLLVLDNGTADPAGTNGASYYNTSTNKFRCYENSAWKDCIGTGGSGSDLQQSNTSISATTVVGTTSAGATSLGTVAVTPSTATGDVYVYTHLWSNALNNTDQTITVELRTGSTCNAGSLLRSQSAPLTSNSGANGPSLFASGIVVNPGASAQTYVVCAYSSTASGISLGGIAVAMVIDTGADLAEIYTTNDETIEEGDVVSLDSGLQAGIKKSQQSYDKTVLGVVSTRPGLVIGSVDKEGVNALPVALSGRVPVKVSSQNGPINSGDYLTTSSIHGVAMKATHPGSIIGTAMTPFEGEGIGQVLVFVKNGFLMGNDPDDESDTASISAQLSEIENVIKTNVIDQVYQSVADLFKKTVEFFGKVIFHNDVSFSGRATFNSDTGGYAMIKAGSLEVSINFDQEYEAPPIVIGSPDTSVLYSISDVSVTGFKIKLDQPEDHDIKFSWTATAIKDAKTFVDPVTPTLVPTVFVEPVLVEPTASPSGEPVLVEPTTLPLPSPTIEATSSTVPVASQSATS